MLLSNNKIPKNKMPDYTEAQQSPAGHDSITNGPVKKTYKTPLLTGFGGMTELTATGSQVGVESGVGGDQTPGITKTPKP